MNTNQDITQLLQEVSNGRQSAQNELFPLIYDNLKRLACKHMAGESSGHTLTPTALVNEAYLRLMKGEHSWEHRRHFFAAATESMRRILIESARRKMASKRGGRQWKAVTLDPNLSDYAQTPEDLMLLDELLTDLEAHDADLGLLVKLRYFGGFTFGEIASMFGFTERTAINKWNLARAWFANTEKQTSG